MSRLLAALTEVAGWVQLAASPALAGAVLGVLGWLWLGGAWWLLPVGLGLLAGGFWAEKVRRHTGTIAYLSRLSAHPELTTNKPMTLAALNDLPLEARAAELARCCGSPAWVAGLGALFPLESEAALLAAADHVWFGLTETDWREAFSHHPKIGDVNALREKFASTAAWAAGEQGAVRQADEATLLALQAGNDAYEQKFGYIFIVCATGKSAAELLALLRARLPHSPAAEIQVAMREQAQITRLRLAKLLAA